MATNMVQTHTIAWFIGRNISGAIINQIKKVGYCMNIETLVALLLMAAIVAVVVRLLSGFTLAGLLVTYVLACLGAIGGWLLQGRLGLPLLYALPLPVDRPPVAIVWPALGALLAALVGSRLWRPTRGARRTR